MNWLQMGVGIALVLLGLSWHSPWSLVLVPVGILVGIGGIIREDDPR